MIFHWSIYHYLLFLGIEEKGLKYIKSLIGKYVFKYLVSSQTLAFQQNKIIY